MEEGLKQIQHISDIRGIAIAGSTSENVMLNEKNISKIANAFAGLLSAKTGKNVNALKIAIGTDSRLSGPVLKNAVIEALTNTGIYVLDCLMVPTSALHIAVSQEKYNCDGGIMIAASHLPYNWNGLKLITKEGVLNKEDIGKILEDTEKIILEKTG